MKKLSDAALFVLPVTVGFTTAMLVLLATSCHPAVQAQPAPCSAGWTFLYTDRQIIHGQLKELAVCRRDQ